MNCFDFVKSSHGGGSGEYVEVAADVPVAVAVRDSRIRPRGRYSAWCSSHGRGSRGVLPLKAGAT